MSSTAPRRWIEVGVTIAATLITIAAADLALQQVVPLLPTRIEVTDGIAAYEASDPELLVLGSSHARGFAVIAERLSKKRPGHQTVLMAVERGKLTSYDWVLRHRLRSLIEERRNLERVILATEWWDACAPDQVPATNVPGRAWTLDHFVEHIADHGINDYNANFLNYHWRRLWSHSILIQDRGVQRLPKKLIEWALPPTAAASKAEHEGRLRWWRVMVEGGYDDPRCFNPGELAAAERVMDYFLDRGVEVTVVLYPRMPSTITEKAQATTLSRFAAVMRGLAEPRGVRVIDWTTRSPLTDAHFMTDFDHTTAEGNRLLAEWGLAGELGFLLEPTAGGPVE